MILKQSFTEINIRIFTELNTQIRCHHRSRLIDWDRGFLGGVLFFFFHFHEQLFPKEAVETCQVFFGIEIELIKESFKSQPKVI